MIKIPVAVIMMLMMILQWQPWAPATLSAPCAAALNLNQIVTVGAMYRWCLSFLQLQPKQRIPPQMSASLPIPPKTSWEVVTHTHLHQPTITTATTATLATITTMKPPTIRKKMALWRLWHTASAYPKVYCTAYRSCFYLVCAQSGTCPLSKEGNSSLCLSTLICIHSLLKVLEVLEVCRCELTKVSYMYTACMWFLCLLSKRREIDNESNELKWNSTGLLFSKPPQYAILVSWNNKIHAQIRTLRHARPLEGKNSCMWGLS